MKTKAEQIAEVKSQIDELQLWFARKPYGFREAASPDQLRQFTDREREQDRLIARLEDLQAE